MEYAIGMPVGLMNEQQQWYVAKGTQMMIMRPSVFGVWSMFLHGASEEMLTDISAKWNLTEEETEHILDGLRSAHLLVKDEALLQCKPAAQGYGLGLQDADGICAVMLGKKETISYPGVLLWSFSNGSRTLQEILDHMPEMAKENYSGGQWAAYVLELLKKNLLLWRE